jgi:hypothetical protein
VEGVGGDRKCLMGWCGGIVAEEGGGTGTGLVSVAILSGR